MAFVSVPKDLTKVKNKIIFNLTKRQLICFGIAAAVGLPFYFLSRGIIGSSNAATGMCLRLPTHRHFVCHDEEKGWASVRKGLKKYDHRKIYPSSGTQVPDGKYVREKIYRGQKEERGNEEC